MAISDCRMKRKRKEKWVPEKEKIIYRTLQQVNLIVEEQHPLLKIGKRGEVYIAFHRGRLYGINILRWDDNNVDIREQHPLDVDKTVAIAEEMGIQYPRNKGNRL